MSEEGNWSRFLLHGIVFVIAFGAMTALARLLPFEPQGFVLWRPGVGLAIAFLLLHTPAYAVWLPLASLATALTASPQSILPLRTLIGIFVFGLAYAGAVAALRRIRGFDPDLARVRDMVILCGVGSAAALVVAAYSVLTGNVPNDEDGRNMLLHHWVGGMTGVVVMTPFFLRWRCWRPRRNLTRLRSIEIAAQAAIIPLLVWLILAQPATSAGGYRYFYLMFLPMLWVSLRGGFDGVILAMLGTQLCLVAGISLAGLDAAAAFDFQSRMLILAFIGLAIGGLASERQRTQQALYESEARLRERQIELARFARASEVGEMASSLAHEVSQPLAATANYLGVSRRLLQATQIDIELVRDTISKASSQADRAGRVLTGLREFLSRGETRQSTMPVAALLDAIRALAEGEAKEAGVELIVRDESRAALVSVDSVQIEQTLLNLIRNAVDAIRDVSARAGRLEIVARIRPDAVEITVEDNGPGVSAEIVDRLFVPFATTKPNGMGLGLAISRSIAEAHGGRIRFQPRAGGGAVFSLVLPKVEES